MFDTSERKNITAIQCEIFAVTLQSGQVMWLHPPFQGDETSWLVPHSFSLHPNETVLRHITTFFCGVLDLNTSIIHSTSWRYEKSLNQLILTYLVVVPEGIWISEWLRNGQLIVEPMAKEAKIAYGDHLAPPAHIMTSNVLAHALDHLALLATYDKAIIAVLEPGWMELLRTRIPKPAGCLTMSK